MFIGMEWNSSQGLWIIKAILDGELQELAGKTLEGTKALFARARARQGREA